MHTCATAKRFARGVPVGRFLPLLGLCFAALNCSQVTPQEPRLPRRALADRQSVGFRPALSVPLVGPQATFQSRADEFLETVRGGTPGSAGQAPLDRGADTNTDSEPDEILLHGGTDQTGPAVYVPTQLRLDPQQETRKAVAQRQRPENGSGVELAWLDSLYRSVMRGLFKDSFSGSGAGLEMGTDFDPDLLGERLFAERNPFEEALFAEDAVAPEVEPAPSEPPPPAPEPPPPTPEPPPVEDPGRWANLLSADEVEGPFPLLLYGDFSESGEERVFRASRDSEGDLVLENSTKFTPPPAFMYAHEEEQVLTTDLDGDGQADLIVASPAVNGTAIRTSHARGGLRFERSTTSLVEGRVLGMAVFELTGDGIDDLVLAVQDTPHLVVYALTTNGLEYEHELALPLAPALLVESHSDGTARILHVFDASLSRLVTLSEGNQGTYVEGPESALNLLNSMEVGDQRSESPLVELISVQNDRGFTLTEITGQGPRLIGSFAVGAEVPLVIFGERFPQGLSAIRLRFLP